jgi:2-hydroxy fatty acid dioxygenase
MPRLPRVLRSATDLDRHLTFYCAYHQDRVNSAIHVLCIWPILWTALALARMAGPVAPLPPALLHATPPALRDAVSPLHLGWAGATVYVVLYPLMQPRAGTLAAALVLAWSVLQVVCMRGCLGAVARLLRDCVA